VLFCTPARGKISAVDLTGLLVFEPLGLPDIWPNRFTNKRKMKSLTNTELSSQLVRCCDTLNL